MKATHNTAPTEFVEANGIRYAYRHFGVDEGVPVIFLQHFRGGLDYWDPAVTDGLARRRTVYLFDNAGVGASGGETPDTIEAMADHVAAFVGALGLSFVDVLGFSIGGMVAQEVALRHPHLVRKLVLAGTGPRGGQPGSEPRVADYATRHEVPTLEDFQFLFFDPAAESQAAGSAFWQRRHQRSADLDQNSSRQAMLAQGAALAAWGSAGDGKFADLARIYHPALIVNGANDIMVPTVNSFTLAQKMPNAKLVVYPNSGHGALFQYADDFVTQAQLFLD